MKLDTFLNLPKDPEIDKRITEQKHTVDATRKAQQIKDHPSLSEIQVPSLPDGFVDLLARTIDDVAQDAETHLAEHLAAHRMDMNHGNWIADGLKHIDDDTCPFCGQNIEDLPLISAYQVVFSDHYNNLKNEITAMRDQLIGRFNEDAISRVKTIERNKGSAEFWSQYCSFDPTALTVSDDIPKAIDQLGRVALGLLDRKGKAPLESIQPGNTFNEADTVYKKARTKARQIAARVQNVNTLISAKKEEVGVTDLQTAEDELARLQAVKVRYTESVASLCNGHIRMTDEKNKLEERKKTIRKQIGAHTENMMKPYEQRTNHYLGIFNAGFRITKIKHEYPGGSAASTYQIVINNTAIGLGNNHTPNDRPSFKNTLSSGDRTTLALAFFLVHLEQDQNLSSKTVVFDDPFGSQDAFRRSRTVLEVVEKGCSCAQVIVLSHDIKFLKSIWDKAPKDKRVALGLHDRRVQGVKIMPLDIELACRGQTATDIQDLQAYLSTGEGKPLDIVRKMRGILETYCRTTYSGYFQGRQAWLGDILREIRGGGNQHPAHELYCDLYQINDYTKKYHHGEDMMDVTPDPIDPRELEGYVKLTLNIVKATPA